MLSTLQIKQLLTTRQVMKLIIKEVVITMTVSTLLGAFLLGALIAVDILIVTAIKHCL